MYFSNSRRSVNLAIFIIMFVNFFCFDVNAFSEHIKHKEIKTPNLIDKLFESIDINEVKRLIDNGIDVNYPSSDGFSALKFAAHRGNFELTQLLLENGAKQDNIRENSAFHTALSKGYKEIAELLFQYGATTTIADDHLNYPIKYAAEKGYLNIVKLILEKDKDEPYLKSNYGINHVIIFAAEEGHLDVVKELVTHGAKTDYSLWGAARRNQLSIVKYLLASGGDVNRVYGTNTVLNYTKSNEILKLLWDGLDKNRLKVNLQKDFENICPNADSKELKRLTKQGNIVDSGDQYKIGKILYECGKIIQAEIWLNYAAAPRPNR
ncbi:MAG TPA: ankyrin repeat domain-containing protein, partial [Emcibacteraceae bacterium]|nr:ankyrin repeat domain-containing protein [Emcibacteraceae bacterium]